MTPAEVHVFPSNMHCSAMRQCLANLSPGGPVAW